MKVRFSDLLKRYGDVCILSEIPFYHKYFEEWCDDISFDLRATRYLEYYYDDLKEMLALKDLNIKDITYTVRELHERKYRQKLWDLKFFVDSDVSNKLCDMIYFGEIDFDVELSAEFIESMFDLATGMKKERFLSEALEILDKQTLFDVAKYLELKEVNHVRTLDHYYEIHGGCLDSFNDFRLAISNRIMKLNMPQMFEAIAQMVVRDLEICPN